MTPFALKCAKQLISIVSQQYPERLGVCVCVNCSLLFQTFWALCAPFVDPKVRTICNGEDLYIAHLPAHVAASLSQVLSLSHTHTLFVSFPRVCHTVHAQTRKKLCFVSGSNSATDPGSCARAHAVLSQFVADEELEPCYGGTHVPYPHPRTYGDVDERIAIYAGTNPPLDSEEEKNAFRRAALGGSDDSDFAADTGDAASSGWSARDLLVSRVETVEVVVPPAGSGGERIARWRFRCLAKDVDFSLDFASSAEAEAEVGEEGGAASAEGPVRDVVIIVAAARRLVHRGTFAVPASGGTLRFTFDNSFSWLANKHVELRWRVDGPGEEVEGEG